jgi:hypothetical protein
MSAKLVTREEFMQKVIIYSLRVCDVVGRGAPEKVADDAQDDIMRAWDAQAAEVERLRAEVEGTAAVVKHLKIAIDVMEKARIEERVGVPLTAENAPRARVVECDGDVMVASGPRGRWWVPTLCADNDSWNVDDVIASGATVLAWRRT